MKLLGFAVLACLPVAAQIEEGLRVYNANCTACHGPEGDMVPGVALRSGTFRRANNDGDLTRIVTSGIPGTPMPPTSLSAQQVAAVIDYLRSPREGPAPATVAGDSGRGRALFEGKGGCLKCHRVRASGSRLGPDLSEIGAVRPAADLERKILEPDSVILPQNRFVRVVTRGGESITGRRLNEDTLTIQLIDSKERLVSLSKAELRQHTLLKNSPMPSYRDKLTSAEIDDLVAYLLSLKGSNTP
jgi:putative heme-binding domain-containing protein